MKCVGQTELQSDRSHREAHVRKDEMADEVWSDLVKKSQNRQTKNGSGSADSRRTRS